MSSSPRPNRNAAHTRAIGRPPAVSSDTNARQNRGLTNWQCRPESFSLSIESKPFDALDTGTTTRTESNQPGIRLTKRIAGFERGNSKTQQGFSGSQPANASWQRGRGLRVHRTALA